MTDSSMSNLNSDVVMQTSNIMTTTPESKGKPMKDEESRSITSRSPREISYRQSAAAVVKERQWHMAVTWYSTLFKYRPARRTFFFFSSEHKQSIVIDTDG